MNIEIIPLSALHAHPANSNVMSAEMLNKLVAHLKRSDRYPPLIVRVMPALGTEPGTVCPDRTRRVRLGPTPGNATQGEACFTCGGSTPGDSTHAPKNKNLAPPPHYQILDGHHRAIALQKLGRDSARCMVWDVDDDEALLLLATLNRLQGQDDPRKRAQILKQLQAKLPRLEALLPEAKQKLQRLLTLAQSQPPAPRPPRVAEQLPAPVHFFLPLPQKIHLEAKLAQIGGTREQALMKLAGWEGELMIA
ncbi:MAG: ParB-like nuclease domain-containing protein [Phycisphaeraceae bacterium]|nr:ParB-like nuclease domain-containing protein [Phycisphaeraceae bacterium]